jgi:hypothetical protein
MANQTTSRLPISRRDAIASLGAISLMALGAGHASAQATPEAATEPVEVTMPDWRFTFLTAADPYEGEITRPSAVPEGLRIVAYEVMLANMSEQFMDFAVRDIRIRDIDGVEYRGGDYQGTEPRMISQNLPNGERARGWVWFGVPVDAEISTILFVAPPPLLRIPLT